MTLICAKGGDLSWTPDADGGVARRHRQNRGGGEGCGYAASLGQRKRVAHIPTAEAARSGLILEGQGQARLHLKSNPPWSHQWGPVQRSGARFLGFRICKAPSPAASGRSKERRRLWKRSMIASLGWTFTRTPWLRACARCRGTR